MFHVWHLFTAASIAYGVAGSLLLWKIPSCGTKTSKGNTPAPADGGDSKNMKNELVSVIIPARNEEKRLPRLLDSLREEMKFLPKEIQLEILVADDRSEDATARIAEQAGARVVKLTEAPADRAGKSRACRNGAEAARGGILLFLDADTWFVPGGLARVLELRQPGLVSIQPYHVTKRFV